jgi:hypothetical protein
MYSEFKPASTFHILSPLHCQLLGVLSYFFNNSGSNSRLQHTTISNGPRYAIHTFREYIVKFKTYHQQLASQRGSGGSAQEMQTLQTYVNEYRNDLDGEVVQCFLRLLEIGTFVRELDEIVEITSDVKGLYQM